jgi:predicted NBD/HSP70 family sugar kinase
MAKNEELRKENIHRVRTCFYEGGSWTKNTLAEKTGLSLAGTTNVLQNLMEKGEILYIGDATSTGGRKSKQYELNPEHCHIGTIDCCRKGNRYSYLVQEINLTNEILQSHTIYSEEGSIEDLRKALRWINKDTKIKFLAVSVPGVCSHGVLRECDFPLLAEVDLGRMIQKECGLPYVIENDVNIACISYAHHDPSLQDIALVYQPEAKYIGCGILIHGKLYNGAHHEAGEMKNLGMHEKDEKKELQRVIYSLQAVLDPQQIIWCSDQVKELNDPFHNLTEIQEIQPLIQKGLHEMALYELLRLKKEED